MRPAARPATSLALASALVLGLAACGDGSSSDAPAPDIEPDVSVLGTDALKFEPTTLTAPAGEIAVELTSEPGVNHDVVVDGEVVVEARRGQTRVGTIELDAGEYTFWCSIPGHRTAGMEGTLTVE